MGSAAVQGFVQGDELHVARDPEGWWWAVGRLGSYGGSRLRHEAVSIALDACASSYGGRCRIVVHFIYGGVAYVIRGTRRRPSSQLFQDAVP